VLAALRLRSARKRPQRRETPVGRGQQELGPSLVDDPEPCVLVVAPERDHQALEDLIHAPNGLEHAARAWPAIEVVPEQDDGVVLGDARHAREQRLQMIELAVNVSDDEGSAA